MTLVTAESCTGGKLASLLSDLEGASDSFDGGYVTYTKRQKVVALGVPHDLLKGKGAVCEEVARAMAQGALQSSRANIAVAITGVAGPTKDEDGNPVGLVFIACARRDDFCGVHQLDCGNVKREEIIFRSLRAALGLLRQALDHHSPAKVA